MNNDTKIIGTLALVALVVGLLGIYQINQQPEQKPVQQFGQYPIITFSGGANNNVTVASTSPTLIFSPGDIKTRAIVCNKGGQKVDLFVASTTAVTGLALNYGITLNPFSSSTEVCADFSGLQGYLYGLATGGTVVVSRVFE